MTTDEAAGYIVEQLKPIMVGIYLKGFGSGFIIGASIVAVAWIAAVLL